jgi:sulfite reductase beta subunit-like hemoprotein
VKKEPMGRVTKRARIQLSWMNHEATCEALMESGFPSDESCVVLYTPKKNKVLMLKDGT